MPALNGKDRAAARLLVAAVVTLLALFIPPTGMTPAAATGEAGPQAGSTDSMRPAGARSVVLRQTRGQVAPALTLRSVPLVVLPAAQLVGAALIGLGVVATVADHGPRWPHGRRPGSRAPPASAR